MSINESNFYYLKLFIKLFGNNYIWIFFGFLILVLLPPLELWHWGFWREYDLDNVRINTITANATAYLIITFTLWQFKRFAGTNILSFIIPSITIIYLTVFSFFIFTRLGYSRHVLLTGYGLNLAYFFIMHFLIQKYQTFSYAVLPFTSIEYLNKNKHIHKIQFISLKQPSLGNLKVRGIIADLHSNQLDKIWGKFLAQCALEHIPVLHIKQIQETLTGRIQIEHLSENQFGSLLPSPFYMAIKRILDIIIIAITLPFTLFLMAMVAVAIKLESKGSVIFTQKRVGLRNEDFKIYKFRSMTIDAENDGAKFAQNYDIRITKVGAWIRKTRIDELPQIWNVLMGDMSLIGPRPEQRAFVNQFEENIPFYIYRHIVRPGMTGWAQVMQGYASNEDDTTIKIQYDFYYIKHFSFWLDILIFLKTIRVIITGFGAK